MAVGLAAWTGESGERGIDIALGDLSDRDGRVTFCAAEMLKDSLGLAAYILTDMAEIGSLKSIKTNVEFLSQGHFDQQRHRGWEYEERS